MLRKTLLIVLPLGLLALLGYYWLGGFNEITVDVVDPGGSPDRGEALPGPVR